MNIFERLSRLIFPHLDEDERTEIAAYSKYITKPEDVDNLTQQDLNMITMRKM